MLTLSLALALALAAPPPSPAVTLGIDVLLTEMPELIQGKRLGLLTHPAAVDAEGRSTIDRLRAAEGSHHCELVQLYGPEHGLRGYKSAGEGMGPARDPDTGLPVEELFGRGKKGRPSPRSLKKIDLLIVDLQDLGSRTYTFASTLGEAMTAAAQASVPVLVLDRPNPSGGVNFEGPVLTASNRSFVGWARTPVTHGLTVGELARYFRAFEDVPATLTVVPMRGWRRTMTWKDTGLFWTPTSPGIPHIASALLYAATGMVGGVTETVSEGAGSTLPFEVIGAPWIAPQVFAAALNSLDLPGLRFRPITFRPRWFTFKDQVLSGVHLVITDPIALRPIRTALAILMTLERLYPGKVVYRDNLRRIWGEPGLPERLREASSLDALEAPWQLDLMAFAARRASVLLYP